jgi:hypothetical protein
MREWERKSLGGVSGKDMLTKSIKCKSSKSVKERLSSDILEKEKKRLWQIGKRKKEKYFDKL